MSTIIEEVHIFMDDYKEANIGIKNAMRVYAFSAFFKWEAIRDKIQEIDAEEVSE